MQTTSLDMDEEVTMMASLLKTLRIEHRIVFNGKKSDVVVSGILYECQIQAKCEPGGDQWFTIGSLPALIQWLANKK